MNTKKVARDTQLVVCNLGMDCEVKVLLGIDIYLYIEGSLYFLVGLGLENGMLQEYVDTLDNVRRGWHGRFL